MKTSAVLPPYGQPIDIAPGIARVVMPLAFELNHVNLWLLKGADDWAVVDAGFNNAETIAHWQEILKSLHHPARLFITHFHPDHFGLSGWLAQETGAPVVMTAGEQKMVRHLTSDDNGAALRDLYTPYYIEAGVDEVLMRQLLDKRVLYKKIVTLPGAIYTVAAGDFVHLGGRDWKIIHGAGHSPDHACLYNPADKIFIAGDIVLPTITPNISYFPGHSQGANPLADYLDTIAAIKKEIPDDVLVLPSHGAPFHGLHARIDKIAAHHAARVQKIAEICGTPKTAYQVMQELFAHRDLSPSDLFFALSETLAHLIYDEKNRRIRKTSRDGVAFYQTEAQ